MMLLDEELAAHGLRLLGGFHPEADEGLDCATLLMVGPDGARFWPVFTQSAEWLGGGADPVDAYSARVLGDIALRHGAQVRFPFGGPPYHPFYSWALRSGQAWASPVALLVHAEQGLFISYRAALLWPTRLPLPAPATRPCDDCAQPCLAACPAGALGAAGYDVPACHGFLDSTQGAACMAQGCAVRRACPIGRGARPVAQSAYHMERFHR